MSEFIPDITPILADDPVSYRGISSSISIDINDIDIIFEIGAKSEKVADKLGFNITDAYIALLENNIVKVHYAWSTVESCFGGTKYPVSLFEASCSDGYVYACLEFQGILYKEDDKRKKKIFFEAGIDYSRCKFFIKDGARFEYLYKRNLKYAVDLFFGINGFEDTYKDRIVLMENGKLVEK
jgi:hypothetical protein